MDAPALLAAGNVVLGAVPIDAPKAVGTAHGGALGDPFASVFATALGETSDSTGAAIPTLDAVPETIGAPGANRAAAPILNLMPGRVPAPIMPVAGETSTDVPSPTPEPTVEGVAVPPAFQPERPTAAVRETRTSPSDALVTADPSRSALAEPASASDGARVTVVRDSGDRPPESPPPGVAVALSDDDAGPNAPITRLAQVSETTDTSGVPATKPPARGRASRAVESAPRTASKAKTTVRSESIVEEPAEPLATPLVVPAEIPLPAVGASSPPQVSATRATAESIVAESPSVPVIDLGPHAAALPSAPDLRAIPTVLVEPAPVSIAPKEPGKTAAALTAEAVVAVPPNARIAQVAADRAPTGPFPKAEVAEGEGKTGEAKVDGVFGGLVLSPDAGKAASDDGTSDPRGQTDERPAAPLDPTPNVAGATPTSATERPEAGGNRPAVDRHLVVRQVADRIESLVAVRPRDGVTIHLEPRDLGSVTLVVKGLSSALDVQVTASDDRVRQSLDASRPELAQALAPRGIELREIRVTPQATPNPSSASTTDSGAGGRAGAQQQPQSRPQAPHANSARTVRDEPAPARRSARASGRGVDLLV